MSQRYFHIEGEEMMFSTLRRKIVYATSSLWIQRCCRQNPSCVWWKLKGQQERFGPLMKRPFETTFLCLKRCCIIPTSFSSFFLRGCTIHNRASRHFVKKWNLNEMRWFFTHWQACDTTHLRNQCKINTLNLNNLKACRTEIPGIRHSRNDKWPEGKKNGDIVL